MNALNRPVLGLGLLLGLAVSSLVAQQPEASRTAADAAPAAATSAPKPAPPAGEAGLVRLNFRNAPLDLVLDYLSEAAGFIIIKETDVKGKVDVWSNQPVSRDEAVDLLNTILKRNECAAIRNGRTLTIVSLDEAKKRDLQVKKGSDAEQIPKTDEMVTQIIPVRHANVAQLIANLQPLLGTYATMTANESANSLLLVATQADVRRMAEIINALDESISSTSTLHVFSLRFADAKELATVIKELFAPASTQQGNNNRGGTSGFFNPFAGGFPGGGFPGAGAQGGAGVGQGGGRGGAGGGTGRSSGGGAVNSRVVAVADERSNSLVVAAPDDVLPMIKDVVRQIDQPVSDITELRVFRLRNSDPIEMADMLSSLFPDESKASGSSNDQQQFRFNRGGPGGGFGGGQRNQASNNGDSDRMKKKGRVLAVADQRTGSVVVSAASELMPQIAEMIAQLDSNPARKQKVFVYSLENADVLQVEQVLRGMFERTTTQNNRNNQNQSSPLNSRSSQGQSSGVGSGFGAGAGTGGLGGNNSGGLGGNRGGF